MITLTHIFTNRRCGRLVKREFGEKKWKGTNRNFFLINEGAKDSYRLISSNSKRCQSGNRKGAKRLIDTKSDCSTKGSLVKTLLRPMFIQIKCARSRDEEMSFTIFRNSRGLSEKKLKNCAYPLRQPKEEMQSWINIKIKKQFKEVRILKNTYVLDGDRRRQNRKQRDQ